MRNQMTIIITLCICFIFVVGCGNKITTKAVQAPINCEETQIPRGKVVCSSINSTENPMCNLTIFGHPKVKYKAISYNGMYGEKELGKLLDGDSVLYPYEKEMTLISIIPYIEKKKLRCENQSFYVKANQFKMQIGNSSN